MFIDSLGGGFIFCYFHPYLGKISNLTRIFFRWVGSTTNQFIDCPLHMMTACWCAVSMLAFFSVHLWMTFDRADWVKNRRNLPKISLKGSCERLFLHLHFELMFENTLDKKRSLRSK